MQARLFLAALACAALSTSAAPAGAQAGDTGERWPDGSWTVVLDSHASAAGLGEAGAGAGEVDATATVDLTVSGGATATPGPPVALLYYGSAEGRTDEGVTGTGEGTFTLTGEARARDGRVALAMSEATVNLIDILVGEGNPGSGSVTVPASTSFPLTVVDGDCGLLEGTWQGTADLLLGTAAGLPGSAGVVWEIDSTFLAVSADVGLDPATWRDSLRGLADRLGALAGEVPAARTPAELAAVADAALAVVDEAETFLAAVDGPTCADPWAFGLGVSGPLSDLLLAAADSAALDVEILWTLAQAAARAGVVHDGGPADALLGALAELVEAAGPQDTDTRVTAAMAAHALGDPELAAAYLDLP